jgi:hypothetical protein
MWWNLPIVLAKKPHSVKQGIISTYSIYYCYIITIVMHCISVTFYMQNMLAGLQTWSRKQQMHKMLKSIVHNSINILIVYAHVCVSLPTLIRLIGVHGLLKIKICLQPFIVSRSISVAKLHSWSLNNNANFTKYFNKLHAGSKARKINDKIIKKLTISRVFKHSSQSRYSRTLSTTVYICPWKTLKEFIFF